MIPHHKENGPISFYFTLDDWRGMLPKKTLDRFQEVSATVREIPSTSSVEASGLARCVIIESSPRVCVCRPHNRYWRSPLCVKCGHIIFHGAHKAVLRFPTPEVTTKSGSCHFSYGHVMLFIGALSASILLLHSSYECHPLVLRMAGGIRSAKADGFHLEADGENRSEKYFTFDTVRVVRQWLSICKRLNSWKKKSLFGAEKLKINGRRKLNFQPRVEIHPVPLYYDKFSKWKWCLQQLQFSEFQLVIFPNWALFTMAMEWFPVILFF